MSRGMVPAPALPPVVTNMPSPIYPAMSPYHSEYSKLVKIKLYKLNIIFRYINYFIKMFNTLILLCV